jgi:hypothetical protein
LKKIGIFAVMLILIAPIAISTNAVIPPPVDFYFHPDLVAGAEIEWQLKKNGFNFEGVEDTDFDIVAGTEWGVGSVFKMVLNENLNDLPLTDPAELFSYAGDWADFYLDGVLITENSTDIEFFGFSTSLVYGLFETGIFPFIMPLTYNYGSGNESFFDLFYDELKLNEFTDTPEPGITIFYTVAMDEKRLTVTTGIDMKISEYGFTVKGEVDANIIYDIQDGVLDEIKIFMKASAMGFTIKYNFLLVNITSPVNLDFEWISGIVAFLSIGVMVVFLKRRR